MSENKYRKIWIAHHGLIPVDEFGDTYQIHHKDRDRANNDISNLECLSIIDHYYIHLSNNEYGACAAIMMCYPERFSEAERKYIAFSADQQRKEKGTGKYTPGTNLKIAKAVRQRVLEGKHHLQGGNIQRETNQKRIALGIHHFQSEENKQRVTLRNEEELKNGSHPFIQKRDTIDAATRNRVAEGKHHFQTNEHSVKVSKWNKTKVAKGIHPFQKKVVCTFCGVSGRGAGFYLKHNDNCISNPNNRLLTCEHCGKTQPLSVFKRYHGDNCKMKFK